MIILALVSVILIFVLFGSFFVTVSGADLTEDEWDDAYESEEEERTSEVLKEREQNQLTLDALNVMSVTELEKALVEHNYHYWVRNESQISDYLYDAIVLRLKSLAPDSPLLTVIGAGGFAGGDFEWGNYIADVIAAYPPPETLETGEKVKHNHPMLSLDKCYDEDTLRKWFAKFEGDVIVSPKIDGMAVSLKYQNNQFVQGATRGTGLEGEIVTEAAKQIVGLPLTINNGGRSIEVRGEAYMPLNIFEEEFAADYANPRNLTAGALKHKTVSKTADYKIRFMAYDLIGETFSTEVEKFARLRELGFETVGIRLIQEDALQSIYDKLLGDRASWNYETDGIVYKTNLTREHDRLGLNSHHPRYAIAYKFQGESGVTELENVEWSVSRTGSINPVAIVKPIALSGVTISRVSLHNLSIMGGLGKDGVLYLGSKVVVMRRGGVIPNIEFVQTHGDVPLTIPKNCPSCGADTYRESDFLHAHHNSACRNFKIGELEHFLKVIRCDGFGEKIVGQLFDLGLVKELPDFFKLTLSQFLTLDRMGEKLATRLLNSLDERRTLPAEQFLRSLGIPELGKHVSLILATDYPDMDRIRSLTVEELLGIHTIGESIANSVVAGLKANTALIDELLTHVTLVWPSAKVTVTSNSACAGKSFLFTGTLDAMRREDAQQMVLDNGGKLVSGVSKNLDFLVIGNGDMLRYEGGWRSSKLKKAESLGGTLKIISETTFMHMLEKNN